MAAALFGCSPGEQVDSTGVPATERITGYTAATLTPLPSADAPAAPTGTAARPTPTPFIYTVVANDTLIGIAARFNITLELLIATNPGLDPSFLSVGTELIIPPGEAGAAGILPTPTPLNVITNLPVCYGTAAGGLWCFFPIENDSDTALENLAGVVTLTTNSGELAATQETAALLNRLPAGGVIPLVVYFDPPVPAWERVTGQVISAIAVPPNDGRYLSVEVVNVEIDIQADGIAASVNGVLQLEADSPAAGILWVVAVAYDENGLPVGIRRWESTAGMGAGEIADFAFVIYSVGGAIDRVELIVEARPEDTVQ